MIERKSVRAGDVLAVVRGSKVLLLALGLANLASTRVAHADSSIQTSSFVSSNPFGATSDFDTRSGSSRAVVHVSSYSVLAGTIFSAGAPLTPVGTQNGSGYGLASATEGVLSAYSSAGGQTSPLVQNATLPNGAATAQWSDQLTIQSVGRSGQSGAFTATIEISGTFGSGVGNRGPLDDPNSDAFVRFLGTGLPTVNPSQIPQRLSEICGGWAYCGRTVNDGPNAYSGSNLVPTIVVSIPFTFGNAVTLGYVLDVYSRGYASSFNTGNGTSAAGSASYANGLRWGGITSVRDANGDPVLDYSTSSTSGFDYGSGAVPEPSASLALASGLLWLYGLRNVRNRNARSA